MLAQIRSFLAVVEEGSLHKAAARLRLSQPALSRQMQALEAELGGSLLERTSSGVRPTNGGYALAGRMPVLLEAYDAALAEVRRTVRGESQQLRVGYVGSAASCYLTPALEEFRARFREARVKLLDLSPGEQIATLRRGEMDLGLTDESATLLTREFYVRKVASGGSVLAVPVNHRLATRASVRVAELKAETFMGAPAEHVPGYDRRLTALCRKCGGFKPKIFVAAGTLADGLALVANEDYVGLLPAYALSLSTPGVEMVPISDPEATWDLYLVWQRGQPSAALRALVELVAEAAKQIAAQPLPTRPGRRGRSAKPKAA